MSRQPSCRIEIRVAAQTPTNDVADAGFQLANTRPYMAKAGIFRPQCSRLDNAYTRFGQHKRRRPGCESIRTIKGHACQLIPYWKRQRSRVCSCDWDRVAHAPRLPAGIQRQAWFRRAKHSKLLRDLSVLFESTSPIDKGQVSKRRNTLLRVGETADYG